MLFMGMDPLKQFKIEKVAEFDVLGQHVVMTNQSLWMLISVIAVSFLYAFAVRKKEIVPGRMQMLAELTYDFIYGMVKDTTGSSGLKFVPFVFTLFLFIAMINLFGMIPGSYTSTSQVFVTGAMAMTVFFMVVFFGVYFHGIKFFGMFWPKGAPLAIAPFIMLLEIMSFVARPATLTIRLCANMMAGHILIKVVATFIVMFMAAIGAMGIIGILGIGVMSIVTFAMLTALTLLEVFVAVLQAYIFTVLACVYLNDALHLH
ncbi:MAG: F0F1 ATP synthase subunit A [Alphaproteobacteria bacterium]|nr:F0F1 ATP synthase subunit A [Alphaproteobacteria bacterium]